MRCRGQASLEYLMTYGWAFVLIVIAGGVLFLVFAPEEQLVFSSDSPTEIAVMGGNAVADDKTSVKLLNSTGGPIDVGSATPTPNTAYQTGCTINGVADTEVVGGGQMTVECALTGDDPTGAITIQYNDQFGYPAETIISIQGGAATGMPPGPGCTPDGCNNNCPAGCGPADDPDCTGTGCCGDGTCDAGEDCSSCPADCACTAPSICCAGSCTVPVCTVNGDCDDADACTADVCSNGGTCTASCSNAQIVACTDGDGCCPFGCTFATDDDCAPGAALSCGFNTPAPGTYVLTADLVCPDGGDLITVDEDNVTIDCQGFSIIGTGNFNDAIFVTNAPNNVAIQNCTIIEQGGGDGAVGIHVSGSGSNLIISGNTVSGMSDNGCEIQGLAGGTISGNSFTGNGTVPFPYAANTLGGCYINNSSNLTLTNNSFNGNNGDGLEISNSSGFTIGPNNNFNSNREDGLDLGNVDNSSITGNIINNNAWGSKPEIYGLYVRNGCSNNTVNNNRLCGNQDNAAYCDGCSGSCGSGTNNAVDGPVSMACNFVASVGC
ncbi:MAG: right-handed parallel beta-helix repeat-containing protein [Candidatus Diapherotrites archaeon]|nr:right-handed parallel beta-helix repeat-containing protein [Candidatus Diapherotrites archaeon]